MATMRAREFAQVFAGEPQDIYQAQSTRQILARTIAELGECGLQRAAASLRRETR